MNMGNLLGYVIGYYIKLGSLKEKNNKALHTLTVFRLNTEHVESGRMFIS